MGPALLASLALAVALATGAPALAAEPISSPVAEPAGLEATGPFGTVAGLAGDAAGAIPDPRSMPVLDGWARGATMVVRPTDGSLSPWHAVALAEPALDPTAPTDLGQGDGDATLTLADSGLFLVGVTGTLRPDGDAMDGTWWWRVAVPDRDRPEDAVGPSVPAIQLASADDDAALEQGSGCYVGTCGDIGGISPPDLLPTVRTIPGAPLSVALGDGSGVVAWSVVATPVDGSSADAVVLGSEDATWSTRAWVAAPPEGDWVVTVSVTFDQARGRADGYGRLVVASPGGG